MEACPVNTTKSFDSDVCIGCEDGCAECDEKDQTICRKCAPGLAMHENKCYEECPVDYLKNEDGSVCEKRTYPLADTFVMFPILGTACFFVLITLASYWLTGHRSLVSSTLIAFFGVIEMFATAY